MKKHGLFWSILILFIASCTSPTAIPVTLTPTLTTAATATSSFTATSTLATTLIGTSVAPAHTPTATTIPTSAAIVTPTPFPSSPLATDELPAPPISLVVDPFDQLGLYALLANNTLYHSVDDGKRWRKLPLPVPERPVEQMNPDLSNALPVTPQRDLVVTRVWPRRILLRVDQTLYRHFEGNDRWQPILDRVVAWAADENEGELIYAWRLGERTQADPGGRLTHGLYTSKNGGLDWTHVYQGFFPPLFKEQDVVVNHEGITALAIDPADPNILYAAADDGLYRSLNGGHTWARFEDGLPPTALAFCWTPLFVGGLGSGPFYVFSEVSPERDGTGAQAILARLEHGTFIPDEDHWQTLGSDVLSMLASSEYGLWGVHTLVVDPDQPDRLYLGSEQGLLRSEDGGETWMPADLGGGMNPVPYGAVYRIAVRPGEESELYLWSDSGLTIHTLSTPLISTADVSHEVQFQVLGQVGGESRALAVNSHAVYLSIGPRIVGLLNSRLAALSDCGLTPPLPGVVNDLVIDEEKGLAYVAAGEAGLLIVDISTLSIARVLGQIKTRYPAQAVALQDGLAVVAEGQPRGKGGASIIDVAVPDMPWQRAYAELPGPASGVALTDSHAYLVYPNGLIALDLSDPDAPVETTRIGLPQCGAAAVVAGSYAYVAADGLRILDLSDPAKPRQVGQMKTTFCPFAVAVNNGLAFFADVFCEFGYCSSTLHIVNVRKPEQPVEVGTWQTDAAVQDIAVYDESVYLASWQKGVEALDVHDPACPRFLGAYGTLGGVIDVVADGGFAYVSDGALSGLRVLDLSTSPRGRFWPKLRGTAAMSWAGGYAVVDGLVYVPVWNEGLRIADVRNPDAPQELSVLDVGMAAQAVIVDNLAYVSIYNGLAVIDVADPTAPRVLSKTMLAGDVSGLAVREGLAYVAVGEEGNKGTLYIIDVREPGHPQQIGAVAINGHGLHVVLAGDFAYVAVLEWLSTTPQGGLLVIDVSEPARLHSAAFLALPSGAFDVQLEGQYALIAGGEAGIYVADISEPTRIRLVGYQDTPGSAQRVSVADGLVYVADGAGGLLILELIRP